MAGESICANCQTPGNKACKNCLLVTYCGKECQQAHWATHKIGCKSELMKATWNPQWIVENRCPAFIGGNGNNSGQTPFGTKKFLWGNVPAIDVLGLASNEGEQYSKDLSLLFAASGDLRNVVKTVANIPRSFSNKVAVTVNDRDANVTARNIILLLVALTCEDEIEALDCMIHTWYSAFIQKQHQDVFREKVLPLLDDVNLKIKTRAAGSIQGKTWKFRSTSLRVVLTKEGWQELRSYLEVPDGLSSTRAHEIRRAVTLAPSRLDYRERDMLTQPPEVRVSDLQFYEDGILLPFGRVRSDFDIPNPTLFQTHAWPMMDSANPKNGWSLPDVLETDIGAATNDTYGKLVQHVKRDLASFRSYIRDHVVEFTVYQRDVVELSALPEIKSSRFARVEVANICDGGYLGIRKTIYYLAPLLQSPQENPQATLITLFMNAVQEMYHNIQSGQNLAEEIMRLSAYLPVTRGTDPKGKVFTLLMLATAIVRDVDKYFDGYMKELDFNRLSQIFNVAMKHEHTIIDKWPMRLKLKPSQEGAKEEFDVLLSSSHLGIERYVEWKRTN